MGWGCSENRCVMRSCDLSPEWPLPLHLELCSRLGPCLASTVSVPMPGYVPCWSWPTDLTSQLHLQPAGHYGLLWKPGVTLTLLAIAGPTLLFCLGTVRMRSLPCLLCCHIQFLAHLPLLLPDGLNLLSCGPALIAPCFVLFSDKCCICFRNGKGRMGFCDSFFFLVCS